MPTSTTASHRDPAIQVERPLSYGALPNKPHVVSLIPRPSAYPHDRSPRTSPAGCASPKPILRRPSALVMHPRPARTRAGAPTAASSTSTPTTTKCSAATKAATLAVSRLSINMHNLLQREWDAFFHRMGHLTTPSSHAASTLSAANARMADAIPSSAADAPYGGTFACASARSQAPRRPRPHSRASPSTEARPTRRGSTLTSSPSTDPATASFMPVIHDEHGALGTDGRALARKQNLRTRGQPRPGVHLRYASAGRYGRTPRTRDLAHQSAPRAPRTKGPVEPDDPLGPHHTVGGGADIDSPGLAGGPARGDGRVRSGPHPRA